MNTYVVLLRGINVGGKNLLRMKELKAQLERSGFKKVRTYIQSGNLVLESAENPEAKIIALIQSKFGLSIDVLALSEGEFTVSVTNNPYGDYEGKFVHFYYCKDLPNVDVSKLNKYTAESERYELFDRVFYLHAPSGIGRSKLVANIESCLGVPATGRNLNTINKLHDMLR